MSEKKCEDIQILMSGKIDGELSPNETAQLETHLNTCDDCRSEYEKLRTLAAAASNLYVPLPHDEIWDNFSERVYNRFERKLGWILFLIGIIALLGFGMYQAAVLPWASLPVKILTALAGTGLITLLVSVLRQRLAVLKEDRYSRDVLR